MSMKPSPLFRMIGQATSRYGIQWGTDIDAMYDVADDATLPCEMLVHVASRFLYFEEKCLCDVDSRTRQAFGLKGLRVPTMIERLRKENDFGRLLFIESKGGIQSNKLGQFYTMRAINEVKENLSVYVLTKSHEDATVYAMGLFDREGKLNCRKIDTKNFQKFVSEQVRLARENVARSSWARRKPEGTWD